MTIFLRKVDTPKRLSYYEAEVMRSEFPSLGQDEYLSDLIFDFKTESGIFSVFEINPDEPEDIIHTLCAIVGKQGNPPKETGFILIEGELLASLASIELEQETEATAAPIKDEKHYNVTVLSSDALNDVVKLIVGNNPETNTLAPDVLGLNIIKLYDNGDLPEANKRLVQKLRDKYSA